jgi:endonuclease/exonuclease/phosphatase family metal-dependent hydrolase
LGIFTTYDILNSGIVWEDSTINGAIFADINLGSDTIRVYNVHLASMGLQLSQYKQKGGYAGKLKKLVSKLKNGATHRSYQVDKLMEHTATSPYPFIICGDFNEMPYSYNYFRFKANLENTFEEAGNGFGFSLNSPLFFLRIDHQFYNSGIKAINYRVDRSMKISDHFPTRAVYKIE